MATSLVVDASFTLKLILPGPQQSRCQTLMTQWERAGYKLYAPTLWLYEMTSALAKTVYLGALIATEAQQALHLAQRLNLQLIHPDENLTQSALEWTLRLQRAAAYDSFYLALAETLAAELWTTDNRLYNAVSASWVHLLK